MLFKIKFISEEVDGFFRELLIDSDATFRSLSDFILDACDYADDQMTEFYICDDEWERHQQVTRWDVSDPDNEEEDLYLMDDTRLSDFIDDKGQRMEYVFDPFSERSFFLQVKEIITGRHLDAPEMTRQSGEPPVQIMQMEDIVAPKATSGKADDIYADDDEMFYGDKDFDSEDFDLEGFEISDEQPY